MTEHLHQSHVRRRGAVGLGRRQKLVLYLLAGERGKSVEDMSFDYVPGLDEDAIRGAIPSLERRGLVDVVDREQQRSGRWARVYGLTQRGREAVERLNADEDLDEGE